MKKLLLITAFIAITSMSFAQTPAVPNGDFENWIAFTPCSGIDSLVNFYNSDVDYYYYTKDRDGTASCLSSPSTIKSTDKYTGSYALKLIPIPVIGGPTAKYTGNAVLLSQFNDLDNNPTGVPFTGRPTKLIGYYKFNRAGSDTLGITVSTSIKDAQTPILYGSFTTTTTKSAYTKFEIDLTSYDNATAEILDLFIGFGNTDGFANVNSYVIIDALSFVYDTPTATVTYTAASPINVYTANKNINFSEDVSDVHVVDMVGAQKIQETTTTKTLNAASLTTGMYIVTYKYNDAYFSKKVVIE